MKKKKKRNLNWICFPLPSVLDNRPLRFEEFLLKQKSVICTSATPGEYELSKINNEIVEQIIRSTGLLDL